MRVARLVPLLAALLPLPLAAEGGAERLPLSLHPENPRYFLFRGKPTVIITSGEHYGALLNLDFDYRAYFDALAADGLNGTRVFSGAYVETGGNFNIARNTLDPAPGRFICPWARSETPGYPDGGNKFDLMRFDEAYFARLRDFVSAAAARGVIVEMNLFCPFYDESQWSVSPQNDKNNVNGLGKVPRTDVYALDKNGGLLAVQEAMVRRIVRELRGADNVYFEICNEPYFGGVTLEWQHRIAEVIEDAQRDFPAKLLISQNVANGRAKVEKPHPAISIFNFHYAAPPDAVAMNYGLGKVIGDNETGFRGTGDDPYRTEAWDFIVAGGGLFNHLDYSFTVESPRGDWTDYPKTQPGGGSPALRRQLRILAEFIRGFEFLKMRPDEAAVKRLEPAAGSARALVETGKQYAVYVRRQPSTGPYSVRWTGFVEAPAAGDYSLSTRSNDGVRLWVDGKLLIDNWSDHAETEDQAAMRFEAGRKYPLKLEYFYNGGQGVMKLLWAGPDGKKGPIPPERLSAPDGARGLRGDYFHGIDLTRAWRSRVDAKVDFAWGTAPPFKEEAAASLVGAAAVGIDLPAGEYWAEWVDVKSGAVSKRERFRHAGGERRMESPVFDGDAALRVREASASAFPLRPSLDGRYLVDRFGRPFLYHADTAWNLVKKLTLDEALVYLDDRKAKGFSAIQIQAVSKEQGPMANRAGEDPFDPADDILRPNEAYWRHLDAVLDAAAARGFAVAVAPLWIRWGGEDKEGWRHRLSDANARPYGRFLAERYRRFDNLIWILGGDADPGDKAPAIRALAAGLRAAAPQQLLTYHAASEHSSAAVFPDEAWIDINLAYSYGEVQLHVRPEFERRPARPIILGESGYEEESNDRRGGSPQRMRRQAYRAVLSGALGGHAFGQKHIWRFDAEWRAALESPASRQMAQLPKLFAERPWHALVPDGYEGILAAGFGEGPDDAPASAQTADRRLAIIYLPSPRALLIEVGRMACPFDASWFDPTDGSVRAALDGAAAPDRGVLELRSPERNAAGDGDWVLILECEDGRR